MCTCSTAKRRRRQARMINGRKANKSTFKELLAAKARNRRK